MSSVRTIVQLNLDRYGITDINLDDYAENTLIVISRIIVKMGNIDGDIIKRLFKYIPNIKNIYVKELYEMNAQRYRFSSLSGNEDVEKRIEQRQKAVLEGINNADDVWPALKEVAILHKGEELAKAYIGMNISKIMITTINFMSVEQQTLFGNDLPYDIRARASYALCELVIMYPNIIDITADFTSNLKKIATTLNPKSLISYKNKVKLLGSQGGTSYYMVLFANWLLISLEAEEIYRKAENIDKGKLKKLEQIREKYGYNSDEYKKYYMTLNKKRQRDKAVEARAKYTFLTPDKVSDEWIASKTDLELAKINYEIKTGQVQLY